MNFFHEPTFRAIFSIALASSFLMLPALADESADLSSQSTEKVESSENTKLAQADKGKDAKGDAKSDSKDEGKDKKAAAKSTGGGSVDLATRMASFTAGVAIGTPIAVFRRTLKEIAQGEHDLVGEPDTWYKKAALVMPGFIAFPFGAVSGGASGTMYSFKNAWTESGRDPFSKDVFSLGDVGD